MIELAESGPWQGTATELLDELKLRAGVEVTRLKGWPKDPRCLSSELSRITPNLRKVGVHVDRWRQPHGQRQKIIELRADANSCGPLRSIGPSERTTPKKRPFLAQERDLSDRRRNPKDASRTDGPQRTANLRPK